MTAIAPSSPSEPRLGPGLAAIERELATLWKPAEGESPKVRACLFNLVAIVKGDTPDDIIRTVDALGTTHPARSLIVAIDDAHAQGFEWDVNAVCRREASGDVVCCERVELKLGKTSPERIASLLGALLLPELTTVVWPISEPTSFPLETLGPLADRWIIDTRTLPLERAARLAETVPGYVADVGWIDAWPWRDLVSRAFDDVAVRPMLAALDTIELSVTAPTTGSLPPDQRLPQEARLFVGWLASRIGHSWTDGKLRLGNHAIEVRVSGVAKAEASAHRLEQVVVRGRLAGRATTVTVKRNFGEDTFEWSVENGAGEGTTFARHAQHVYPLADERLVARALDAAESDSVLRASIIAGASSF